MARRKIRATDFPPDVLDKVAYAVNNFKGQAPELESAIGMLFVGHAFGWKILYVIHSVRTVQKYERTLGITVKETFPEETDHSDRSLGFQIASKLTNFWRVMRGIDTVEGARDKTIVKA